MDETTLNPKSFFDRCRQLVEAGRPFITVTIVETEGSVPHDIGGKMIVTFEGLDYGTVGGGRLEATALETASELLKSGGTPQLVHWNLKTDIAMTCGGRVRLFFEPVNVAVWNVVIFGAGHVAQALSRLLGSLPCRVTCADPRMEWLERLPDHVHRIHTESASQVISQLDDSAYIVCMTKGHQTDLPILQEIWKQRRIFSFVGVIGSKSKAGVLRRELRESEMSNPELQFHCPIGLPIGTNHPGEIAISIAAQLIQVRDAIANQSRPKPDETS